MPKLHGRIINKFTRQPITGPAVGLRRLPSTFSENVEVDSDGEFDHNLIVSPSLQRFEMKIDKDPGFKYRILTFHVDPDEVTKDLGEIELEPYMVIHPGAS